MVLTFFILVNLLTNYISDKLEDLQEAGFKDSRKTLSISRHFRLFQKIAVQKISEISPDEILRESLFVFFVKGTVM